MFSERKKLIFITRLILAVFLIIGCRFFYLQIFKSGELQQKVTEQRVKKIVNVPERGKIVDRNGNVLAMSLMAQDIAVYPNLITSKARQEMVADLLSTTIGVSKNYVLQQLNKKDKNGKPVQWASIAKQVDPDKAYKVKQKNIGGIEITQSPKRYYPNGNLASSIMGFVNSQNVPGAGLELGMSKYLDGVPGYTLAETDNLGKIIPIGYQNISSPIDGQDVHLTIDSYIQYVLETRLQQGMKEMHPQSIHGIVMDPNTGEVLAMASYPSFDPSNYGKSKSNTWTNNPATFVYEPGSTFKPLYMAMALQNGSINENSSWYDSTGYLNINGTNIQNDNGEILGHLGLADIIIHSSNVGMMHISQQMTSQQAVDGLRKAGIGQQTGIELPGEEYGLFPTVNSLNHDPIRKATISFGQGISTTPVQLTTALSAVINGGYKVHAKLVKDVEDSAGNILYKPSDDREKIYSDKVSSLIRSYMHANSLKGSGVNEQIAGYDMGSKTGSAWVADHGIYKKGVTVGSFVGFAPLNHPQVICMIVVDQPKGIVYGEQAAGPIFKDVMTQVLQYLNVKKNGEKETPSITVPKVTNDLVNDAKAAIENQVSNVSVKTAGNGEVVTSQSYEYKNNQLIVTLGTSPLVVNNTLNMPYLIGKTTKEVDDFFKPYHIIPEYHGSGNVVDQDTQPGTQIKHKNIVFWLK